MALSFGKASFSPIRGLTWSEEITVLQGRNGPPVDLTGKTCAMNVRTKIGAEDVVMMLDEDNGRLVVEDAENGKVRLLVTADEMLEFPESSYRKAKYVYDAIVITPATGGDAEVREPIIGGKVTVKHAVTRPWEA